MDSIIPTSLQVSLRLILKDNFQLAAPSLWRGQVVPSRTSFLSLSSALTDMAFIYSLLRQHPVNSEGKIRVSQSLPALPEVLSVVILDTPVSLTPYIQSNPLILPQKTIYFSIHCHGPSSSKLLDLPIWACSVASWLYSSGKSFRKHPCGVFLRPTLIIFFTDSTITWFS